MPRSELQQQTGGAVRKLTMAPKRSRHRKLTSAAPRSMKVRARPATRSMVDQEASSRVLPLATPPKKKGRLSKRCVFVDDEVQVDDEDSNNVNEEIEDTDENEEVRSESDDGETEAKHSRQLGKQVSLGLMQSVLSQFYVKRRTQPPMVPLCRLVAHEAVRFATDDAQWLIPSFDTAAYMENMGYFLVSVGGPNGVSMPVTLHNMEEWGPIWCKKNEEFERALGKEWQDLKGKKFLVWDGNHRLKTWWKRIKEKYPDDPAYHVSVRCQFIEVSKSKEAELLLALDTTNAISRAHATPNIAHEVYLFQKFGIANKESILERLSPEMRKWAEIEMQIEARYYHGQVPWYNSPCGLIFQLVWKDEFNAYISKETAKIEALGLDEVERRKRLDKATRAEEDRLKDRGYKYLSIANPSNGEDFFKLLYNIKWDDTSMLKITRDKLYCLASSKITPERKKIILHLMSLTKAKDPQYSHFGDYKNFRGYMKKEVYWAHMQMEASRTIQQIQVEGPQLPTCFDEFFKTNLKAHILQAFVHLLDGVKSSDDEEKMPELLFSAKRVVYRWLRACVDERKLVALPEVTVEWVDTKDENTMYSPSLLEQGITQWEAISCPWWLDYPLGITPKQEASLRARFMEETHVASRMDEGAPSIAISVPTNLEDDGAHHNQGEAHAEEANTPSSQHTASSSHVQSVPNKKGKNLMAHAETPLQPPTKEVPQSSRDATTSFVAESSLGRPNWERRPLTRSVGSQYTSVVDALLVDITQIDKFALDSINKFLAMQRVDLYHKEGMSCEKVARLIFADFPTGLIVDALGTPSFDGMTIPKWNVFSKHLVTGCMDLAQEYLADEGFLISMCLAEHIGDLIVDGARVGLVLHRTWTLFCDSKAYRHPVTREAVLDLTICLWHRAGYAVPTYNREAGEVVDPVLFPSQRSYVMDGTVAPTIVDGAPVRGGAERSLVFFKWLLATFTERHDYVLDVFAGCGGLGMASAEEGRHCMLLELDDLPYGACLSTLVCGPVPSREMAYIL